MDLGQLKMGTKSLRKTKGRVDYSPPTQDPPLDCFQSEGANSGITIDDDEEDLIPLTSVTDILSASSPLVGEEEGEEGRRVSDGSIVEEDDYYDIFTLDLLQTSVEFILPAGTSFSSSSPLKRTSLDASIAPSDTFTTLSIVDPLDINLSIHVLAAPHPPLLKQDIEGGEGVDEKERDESPSYTLMEEGIRARHNQALEQYYHLSLFKVSRR